MIILFGRGRINAQRVKGRYFIMLPPPSGWSCHIYLPFATLGSKCYCSGGMRCVREINVNRRQDFRVHLVTSVKIRAVEFNLHLFSFSSRSAVDWKLRGIFRNWSDLFLNQQLGQLRRFNYVKLLCVISRFAAQRLLIAKLTLHL